jgi:hypothetical protein
MLSNIKPLALSLHLPIGLGMATKAKHKARKLAPIIFDGSTRDVKPGENISEYEVCNLCNHDGRLCFRVNPLGKLVYHHN